nr:immunoglobulin heavy chain junction region [Mus musculus]MBK4187955.1 immunoglobulin heavy chain junction region [Mus musculus]MBK4187956.1 immunoglobulin heavy chain junction region [Mus musculus]MBK4187957.1 immunoglobulin heavy chain junction region [Mus musculus]
CARHYDYYALDFW